MIWAMLALLGPVRAEDVRPFTVEDLLNVQRISDLKISPDGQWLVYVVTALNKEKNRKDSNLWRLPVAGGEPRPLTKSDKSNQHPAWSPDSKKIAFVSNRDGTSQVWMLDTSGEEPKKITNLSTEVSDLLWSPDGSHLAFVSSVYPGCSDDACNKERSEKAANNPVKAKVFDRLLFRHWTSWKDGKRDHLFVVPASGGTARDLTPGDYDAPPFSLGGPPGFAFSPDGKEICFARNTDKDEALSTNSDLFIVSVAGGQAKRITKNPAADLSPLYSPDGRYIAYRAQARPGYESDRWRLMLYERKTGKITNLTEHFDRWVDSLVWSPDSEKIYFTADDQGYGSPIFMVTLRDQKVQKIIGKSSNDDVSLTPDGKTLFFTQQSFTQPKEIFRANADGSGVTRRTKTNDALMSTRDLGAYESVSYEGAAGAMVQAWIVKPPKFDPNKKYPLLLLVHGGPQSAWNNVFHARWNAQVFAAPGYVVLMPNPRGSVGFGQKFIDDINADWGGKPYEEVMKAVDHVVGLGYIDKDRIGAAGGSYGGYMIDWIAGHTDRFKALVSHAGVFNLTSEFGVTEELWFPTWEFRGTPWTSKAIYEKGSPHNYVQNFKTPTLVIHGELDFRVPIGEGFQMFTALQSMNVPSKMLYFPDEGHWVLKPQNTDLWYKMVLDWLGKYLRPEKF